jgi:hypothetical protein
MKKKKKKLLFTKYDINKINIDVKEKNVKSRPLL